MTIAAEILRSKPEQTVHTIGPDDTVLDAVKLLAARNIGALVVVDGGQVIGIISERDYTRKIVLLERSSRDTLVRDIMTRSVMYVRPDQDSEECMTLMTQNRLRHLPVMENEKLIGIISIGDLVKHIVANQRYIIGQLEQYIAGQQG